MRARATVYALFSTFLAIHCDRIALSGVDEPPRCTWSECEILNIQENNGVCSPWRCDLSTNTCQRSLTEIADGKDNNCDGVIDDSAWWSTPPRSVGRTPDRVDSISSSMRSETSQGIFYTTEARTGSFGAITTATTFDAIHYTHTWNGSQQRESCPVYRQDGMIDTGMACGFSEISAAFVDASTRGWFMAVVNPLGCLDGQIRAGYFTEPNSAGGGMFTLSQRSNIGAGVDVQSSPQAGAVNPQCTGAVGVPPAGASRVSLAALNGTSPTALVAWQGRAFEETRCGAEERGIRALLVKLDTNMTVAAVEDGRSFSLDGTRGSGRPAVLGVGREDPSSRAFIVGYGGANGENMGVRLHLVRHVQPPGNNPAQLDRAQHQRIAFIEGMGGVVDQVVLAAGSSHPRDNVSGIDLGVVWKEGCEGVNNRLWFSQLRLDPPQVQPTMASASAPALLAEGDVDLPSIAYVTSPFVQVGFSRDGLVANETTRAGWVVTWVERSGGTNRVIGRRVLELDARPLGEAPVLVREEIPGAVYQAVHPIAESRAVTCVIHSSTEGELWVGDFFCPRSGGSSSSSQERGCLP